MAMRARTLVIAFDAADPAVVLDLAGRGRMPNVSALLEQGVSAAMRNPSGCYVGATWPSLFTGVSLVAAIAARY